MTSYTITSKTTGADLGTYEGETALAAYAAMCRDAGYDVTAVDGELRGSAEALRLCDFDSVTVVTS